MRNTWSPGWIALVGCISMIWKLLWRESNLRVRFDPEAVELQHLFYAVLVAAFVKHDRGTSSDDAPIHVAGRSSTLRASHSRPPPVWIQAFLTTTVAGSSAECVAGASGMAHAATLTASARLDDECGVLRPLIAHQSECKVRTHGCRPARNELVALEFAVDRQLNESE